MVSRMFYIVKYQKPAAHKVKSINIDLDTSPGFSKLKDAEIHFYNQCTKFANNKISFRIDNSLVTKALRAMEFYNTSAKKFYIKTRELNEYGKYKFRSYNISEYKNMLDLKQAIGGK
jgi:hypothetical protein